MLQHEENKWIFGDRVPTRHDNGCIGRVGSRVVGSVQGVDMDQEGT